jgi:signal transduction histidine kinase
MVILIFYTAWEERRTARLSAQQTALSVAQLVAVEQDRLIAATHQLLMTLAELREVREQRVAECNETFAKLMKRFPYYTNVAAATPSGEIFCSGLSGAKMTSISDREYFQEAVRERRLAMSHVLFGRMSGKPNISIAYPSFDSGGPVHAVVFVGLDLGWLNSIAAKVQMPPESVILAIDENGTIFARYPDPEQWLGKSAHDELVKTIIEQKEGTTESERPGGVRRLYGFTTLSRLGNHGALYVSVGIPNDVAFAASNRGFYRSLLVLGFLSILAAVATWVGAHVLVRRRLEHVIDVARSFGDSGLEQSRTSAPTVSKAGAGQYGEVVEEMWSSLQKVTSRQADFAAMIAHDLRNSIHTGGIAAALLLEHTGELTDNQRSLVKSIQDSYKELAEITNDFMDFSKFKAGYLNLERKDCDTPSLLGEIAHKYLPLAEQRKLRLKFSVAPTVGTVFGDRRKLEQVVGNLLMNAFKFTSEGGEITLSATRIAGGVEISVSDTGIGIAEDEVQLLFAPYRQTESARKSRHKGTGLGLLICKMIVEGHGGAIRVESGLNKGTVFYVWIPDRPNGLEQSLATA